MAVDRNIAAHPKMPHFYTGIQEMYAAELYPFLGIFPGTMEWPGRSSVFGIDAEVDDMNYVNMD
jgi:hypothetical protein